MQISEHLIKLCVAAALPLLPCCRAADEPSAAKGYEPRVEVSVAAPEPTRTDIDAASGAARWTEGDKIAVWASADGNTFALEAQPFAIYHYGADYSAARFTATIAPMEAGSYAYYAVSPLPESRDATVARYTLPSAQSGKFEPALDIMAARPIAAAQLEEGLNDDILFEFSHLTHLVRLDIPNGGNALGKPVSRIEMTFPAEVTGTVEVDATGGVAPVLTNGSNTVAITLPQGVNEGESVWITLFPTTLSGSISYRAYTAEGIASAEGSIPVDKTLLAAHITPVDLPIPQSESTVFDFSIGENHLGEAVRSITIRNRNTHETFCTATLAEGATTFSHTVKGDLPSGVSGGAFEAVFESDNAVVTQPFTMPSIVEFGHNAIPAIDVPYLFRCDFTGITRDFTWSGSGLTFTMFDDYGLAGWSGDQVNLYTGSHITLNGTSTSKSLVATGPMSAIKSGSQGVKLTVTLLIAGSNTYNFYAYLTNASGALGYTWLGQFKDSFDSATIDGHQGDLSSLDYRSCTFSQNATSATRFALGNENTVGSGVTIYIKEIKISIAQ